MLRGPGPGSCPHTGLGPQHGGDREGTWPRRLEVTVWLQLTVGRRESPEITGVWKPLGPPPSKSGESGESGIPGRKQSKEADTKHVRLQTADWRAARRWPALSPLKL